MKTYQKIILVWIVTGFIVIGFVVWGFQPHNKKQTPLTKVQTQKQSPQIKTFNLQIPMLSYTWVKDINDNLKIVFKIVNNDSTTFQGYVCVCTYNSVYPMFVGVRKGLPQNLFEGERLNIKGGQSQKIEAWLPIPPKSSRHDWTSYRILLYTRGGEKVKSSSYQINKW